MADVKFPSTRREVIQALAALSDTEYQQRVWVEREYPTPTYYDDLTMNVHTLYDDSRVLPEPEDCVGSVLLPGAEVHRLRALDQVLGPLIDDLGDAPDAVYLADHRWVEVTAAAGRALTATVLAGGFWSQ